MGPRRRRRLRPRPLCVVGLEAATAGRPASGSSPFAATSIAPRRTPCRCSTSNPGAAPIGAGAGAGGSPTLHAAADAAAALRRSTATATTGNLTRDRSCWCARTVATTPAARRSGGHSPATCASSTGSDDVWECSHIGGDRFAANLVILPEGLYFGRCDSAAAEQVIDDYERGEIYLDNYRGRSVLGFYEQAAEYFVRRRARPDVDRGRHRRPPPRCDPGDVRRRHRRSTASDELSRSASSGPRRRRSHRSRAPVRPASGCRATSSSRSTTADERCPGSRDQRPPRPQLPPALRRGDDLQPRRRSRPRRLPVAGVGDHPQPVADLPDRRRPAAALAALRVAGRSADRPSRSSPADDRSPTRPGRGHGVRGDRRGLPRRRPPRTGRARRRRLDRRLAVRLRARRHVPARDR